MEEVEELKQADEKNNELLVKLESETELVRQKLAASEQQAELASATAQQKYTLLSKAFQRLQSINANLLPPKHCNCGLSCVVMWQGWGRRRRSLVHFSGAYFSDPVM